LADGAAQVGSVVGNAVGHAVGGAPQALPGNTAPAPLFATERERQAAAVVMEVLGTYEAKPEQAPTRQALLNAELQARIAEAVREKLPPRAGRPGAG
jgi:type III restriction enzyme